ncbi:unnamed protein product, partial [Symbiodinium microadriaticum]
VERVQNQRLRAAPKAAAASSSRLIDLTPSPKKRPPARSDSCVALELALNDLWEFQPASGKHALKDLLKTINALTPDVQQEDPAAYDELLHWDVAGWVAELKEKMVAETDEVHAKPEQRKKQKK